MRELLFPGGILGNSWWRCAAWPSKSWPFFSHPFSALASKIHTHFQTSLTNSWGQLVASLLRKKDFLQSISNSHISLYFLFICNWNDTCVHTVPVVSLKTITNSRPKWAKSIPIFKPKWPKHHTLWGSTYLYGLCKGVPPWVLVQRTNPDSFFCCCIVKPRD